MNTARANQSTQLSIDTRKLMQARAVARLVMMADELPHQMADDMICAASLVDDILEEVIEEYPDCAELDNASALAGMVVAAGYEDDQRDDIARAAAVISKLIDSAIEVIEAIETQEAA